MKPEPSSQWRKLERFASKKGFFFIQMPCKYLVRNHLNRFISSMPIWFLSVPINFTVQKVPAPCLFVRLCSQTQSFLEAATKTNGVLELKTWRRSSGLRRLWKDSSKLLC